MNCIKAQIEASHGIIRVCTILVLILGSFSNLTCSLSFWLGAMLLLPGYSGKYTSVYVLGHFLIFAVSANCKNALLLFKSPSAGLTPRRKYLNLIQPLLHINLLLDLKQWQTARLASTAITMYQRACPSSCMALSFCAS